MAETAVVASSPTSLVAAGSSPAGNGTTANTANSATASTDKQHRDPKDAAAAEFMDRARSNVGSASATGLQG